ncbi:antibiotic transporter [Oceanicola sp. 22II-s10i]|uniref:MFS transporter n=1 Tax=Oceanicola sp. 22II-s10i TaxID=1317116 RepID=UPI000B520443|nr:MFS transporter [Oceanicola sp. 22II-s10i]OWU85091.1 antibiotic transporter [Oceanicola sp. 22II-s10i]
MRAGLLRTNRDFRLMFGAASLSNLGDGIAMVAIPWLATLLTDSPLLISAVAMAQRLPWFLFALPAGVWTDRADRRVLMIRADIARAGLMLCTLGMVLGGTSGGPAAVLPLALIAFLLGTAEVIRDNAAQTVLPSIVPKDDLEDANGQMWSAEQVTGQFIGPPLAGLLIAAGIALPFGLDAGIYALTAAMIWLIALPPRRVVAHARFWPALREGLGWMMRHATILRLAVMLGAINAVFTGGMTILVLYAQEVLELSASSYGLLLTFGAVGGVLGGLVAPALSRRIGMRRSLLAALAVFTLSNALIGFFSGLPLVALSLALEAAAGMLWNVVTVSYRQRLIPDDLLGRVNSAYRFFGWGAMPFGALGAGALVTVVEPSLGRDAALHAPYVLATAVCAALVVYAALRLRPVD